MAGEFKKQYRGCSRLHFAIRTVSTDGTVTYAVPKLLAPCKTINAANEQAKEKVFADNKAKYGVKGGFAYTRTFDTFPIMDDVLAELFGDSVLEVGDIKAYGENPDAEEVEVAIGYALHDGDEDNPSELVWVFRAAAQKRPDVVSNTITSGDTSSTGEQIAFDVYTPEKAWTATKKKNPTIKIPVTAGVDVDKWFAQVVTWDNISTIFATT